MSLNDFFQGKALTIYNNKENTGKNGGKAYFIYLIQILNSNLDKNINSVTNINQIVEMVFNNDSIKKIAKESNMCPNNIDKARVFFEEYRQTLISL
jgi:hypothetical protein